MILWSDFSEAEITLPLLESAFLRAGKETNSSDKEIAVYAFELYTFKCTGKQGRVRRVPNKTTMF